MSLTVPSGRWRTRPDDPHDVLVAHPVHVGADVLPGSTTTCTMPATSRTSRNTTPPWSRRPSTQPQTATSRSMSVLRRSPARSVRIIAGCPLSGRAQSSLASTQPAGDQLSRHLDLLARPHVLHAHRAVARPRACRGSTAKRAPDPVGRLHLCLDGPAAVGAVGAHAVLPQLGDEQRHLGGVAPMPSTTNTSAAAAVTGQDVFGRRRRSAPARCRCRSRCPAWACRPSPRPACRSDRRRRCAFWAASSAWLLNSNVVLV